VETVSRGRLRVEVAEQMAGCGVYIYIHIYKYIYTHVQGGARSVAGGDGVEMENVSEVWGGYD